MSIGSVGSSLLYAAYFHGLTSVLTPKTRFLFCKHDLMPNMMTNQTLLTLDRLEGLISNYREAYSG